jgi:hypothetical protein
MDEVIDLNLPWLPDGGASDPHLLAEDTGPTIVIYRTAVTAPSDEPFAVLRFPMCKIVKFGYPNDEALPGHPLYAKGLNHYSVFEVLNSSWSKVLSEQNLVSFPNPRPTARTGRHFVVTFHDSTLECIADHIEGRFAGSLKEAMRNEDATFTSA